jgi:hypothetical protein
MVVQRAGADVNGGAEAVCRDVASAMSGVECHARHDDGA